MQAQKTLAFQVFYQGREYRIHVDGHIEGFKEIIEGPPALRDAPNSIICNHYPDLEARAVARALSSTLASPKRSLNDSANGGSFLSSGGSQGITPSNSEKTL
jgi:hypothetical protein